MTTLVKGLMTASSKMPTLLKGVIGYTGHRIYRTKLPGPEVSGISGAYCT